MKLTGCLPCFVAGFAAAAALAAAFAFAWSGYARIAAMSTIHDPLLSALTELQATARRGESAEVARRTEQLRLCWAAFAHAGGETPELFVSRLAAGEETPCVAGGARNGQPDGG